MACFLRLKIVSQYIGDYAVIAGTKSSLRSFPERRAQQLKSSIKPEYLLKKFIGGEGGLIGTLWVVLVTGVIQLVGGFAGAKSRGAKLLAGWQQVCGSVILGSLLSVNSALGVYAFTYPGVDVGIMTFLITLSIVPGSFFDWIFFRHPLNSKQWLGVSIYLMAGWASLNFVNLNSMLNLPVWMWLALTIGLVLAVNEAISQAIQKADPFVNNFWVGLTTIILFSFFLTFSGGWKLIHDFSDKWRVGSLATGLVIFGMIYFKIMSYKGGATIALKKMVMQGTRLVSAILLGAMIYGEPITSGKIIAILLFFVAFALTDKSTYEFLFKKERATSS